MSQVKLDILYEDNHIIAVNKPAGMLVQGDSTGDLSLFDHVKDYLKVAYNKPGNVYLGLPHRIDRPVSGVVLLARTSKCAERLSKLFANQDISKIYWAVTQSIPEEKQGHLVHYLLKDRLKNKSRISKESHPKAKRAELKYEWLESTNRYHLLEVTLMTGRHHQIRAQLSAIGCPIKGDLKYGARKSNGPNGIHLHARKVKFIHPVSKESLEIIANPPTDVLWGLFLARAKEQPPKI